MDRFMMQIKVGYPTREDELLIMERQLSPTQERPQQVITPEVLQRARGVIGEVYLDDKVKRYILDLVFATREPETVKGLKGYGALIRYGASPRASIWLARAARAHAFMKRRGYVIPEDVKALAPDILRHRLIPSYEAEAEEVSSDDLIERLLETVEVP